MSYYHHLIKSAVVPALLLDTYTGASAAYSLRKLSTSYAGNCIRVRRSSDNTEQDFGFSSGVLDTASLLTFCGVGSGYVVKWYDQSGNANNSTLNASADQCEIVISGVVVVDANGKYALKRRTYYSRYSLTTPINQAATFSSTYVYTQNSSTGNCAFEGTCYTYNNQGATIYFYDGIAPTTFGTISNGIKSIFTYKASSLVRNYVNNSQAGTSQPSVNNPGAWSYILNRGYDMSPFVNELILWTSDLSTNRTLIETNVNAYYGIY